MERKLFIANGKEIAASICCRITRMEEKEGEENIRALEKETT